LCFNEELILKLFTLKIKNNFCVDEAWQFFEQAGCPVAYAEEGEALLLHLFFKPEQNILQLPWVLGLEETEQSIDWNAQWAEHGLHYENGCLNIQLSEFGREGHLKLTPGPGFGDLSHPTTKIVLQLIGKVLVGQPFIDIGSGSGVLSLAALQWGSSFAYGIDIDENALRHARENAVLNGVEKKWLFCLPQQFESRVAEPLLIAMNMISSEQKAAWNSLEILHDKQAILVVSGLQKNETENYLEEAANRQWHFVEAIEEEGWVGFCFNINI